MTPKRAVAIRHVPFEDLGTFGPGLRGAGYEPCYLDAGVDDLAMADVENADLLIVLGGPIGAYEEHIYPFLLDELALISRWIEAGRPTLGICLGAQLIARALGGRVFPTGTKEIGWGGLDLSDAGLASPLRHLEGRQVLHWHGDTFDLPDGCTLLASTSVCRHQAFTRGANLLALQFHLEVETTNIERWLIGHACELAGAAISVADLRSQSRDAAPALRSAGEALLAEWLAGLE